MNFLTIIFVLISVEYYKGVNMIDRIEERRVYLTDLTYTRPNEIDDIIDQICKTVVIRNYTDGCSFDEERGSTKHEYDILRPIIYSAIYTFTHDKRADVQTIVDMAEIVAMKFLHKGSVYSEHINCYDTVYCPLQRLFGVWG